MKLYGDNLHEMSKPVSGKTKTTTRNNSTNLSSAELAQRVVKIKNVMLQPTDSSISRLWLCETIFDSIFYRKYRANPFSRETSGLRKLFSTRMDVLGCFNNRRDIAARSYRKRIILSSAR